MWVNPITENSPPATKQSEIQQIAEQSKLLLEFPLWNPIIISVMRDWKHGDLSHLYYYCCL